MTTKLTQRQRDKLIEAAQNSIEFTVEGRIPFPIDMLRYDLCRPATESDSNMIEVTFRVNTGSPNRVNLKGLKPPTAARWNSFGWRLVEDYR